MSNHVLIRDFQRGGSRSEHTPRGRTSRPKTFKTEEAANKWAALKGLKDFKLENLHNEESKTKKIRIAVA